MASSAALSYLFFKEASGGGLGKMPLTYRGDGVSAGCE